MGNGKEIRLSPEDEQLLRKFQVALAESVPIPSITEIRADEHGMDFIRRQTAAKRERNKAVFAAEKEVSKQLKAELVLLRNDALQGAIDPRPIAQALRNHGID